MTERDKFLSDMRVGIVTFTSLILLISGVLFAGGDKGVLFQKTLPLTARINDISGLKKGATVTMGGMNIGRVTGVQMLNGETVNLIEVSMQVRSDIEYRIKSDSKPSVRTQGMLGDRYLEITPGSPEAELLKRGEPLVGSSTSNFDDTLTQARATLQETTKMLEAINKQQGTVGQLVYDEQFYSKLTDITVELNDLIKDFKKNPRRYIKFSLF
jgi:phospholipid/cholesterol/gamma-HCH transport system substrate-binding protein